MIIPSTDDKKTAAASYIFEFYQNIQLLTTNYSNYINVMLEFENRFGDDTEKADDSAKEVINNWVQTVRFYCHKCYIQYKTIIPSLKLKESPDIDKKYSIISRKFIIDRKELAEFVTLMNSILVDGVIQELLSNNQEFIKNIYDE